MIKEEREKKFNSLLKLEEELGIDIEIFLKAITNGIWCRKQLKEYKGYYKQSSPFPVMPVKDHDGVWRFYCDPTSPGGDTEYGPATIFWHRVALSDYGNSWALTRKELQ